MKKIIISTKIVLIISLLLFCNSNFAVSFSDNYTTEQPVVESPFTNQPSSFSFFQEASFNLLGDDDEPPPDDPQEPEASVIIGGYMIPFCIFIILYGAYKLTNRKTEKEQKVTIS